MAVGRCEHPFSRFYRDGFVIDAMLSIMAVLAQLPVERSDADSMTSCADARPETHQSNSQCNVELQKFARYRNTENTVTICALQEVCRDGFTSTFTENFKVYWFDEGSGQRGVGFALHKHYVHLVKAVHPIPGSNGRIIYFASR